MSTIRKIDSKYILNNKILKYLIVGFSLFTTFLCWSVSSPLGSAPDDAFHAAQIWCSNGPSPQSCETISKNGDVYTVRTPYISPSCFWNPVLQNASCTTSKDHETEQVISFGKSDYPRGMYRLMHFFVSNNPVRSVLQMRIFSGFLATVIMLAILLLSPRKLRFAFVISWLPVLTPHGFFFISSINPTGWSFLSIATNWTFLYLLLSEIKISNLRSRRIALISVFYLVTLLVGLSSRWDSRIFLIITSAVTFLIVNQQRKWLKMSHLIAFVTSFAAFVIILARQNYRIRSSLTLSSGGNSSGFNSLQYFIYLLVHLIEFPIGVFGVDTAWGGLGGLYPSTPPMVGYIGFSIAICTIAIACIKLNRIQFVSSSILMLTIFGAVYQQQNVNRFLVGDMVAPRYIMGMVAVLIGVVTLTSTSDESFLFTKHFKIVGIIGLGTAQSVALYSNMDRFITFGLGTTGTFKGFNQTGRWWWNTSISPYVVWALGTASFVLFLISAWGVCAPRASHETI